MSTCTCQSINYPGKSDNHNIDHANQYCNKYVIIYFLSPYIFILRKRISATQKFFLSHTHELLSHTYDLLCHTYDLLSHTYEIISNTYEIITPTYDLL